MTDAEFLKLKNDVRALQAKCRNGFPKHLINESNDLHADCYGTLGLLLAELEKSRSETSKG